MCIRGVLTTVRKRSKKKTFTLLFLREDAKESKSFWLPPFIIYSMAIFGLVSVITVSFLTYSFVHYQITIENNLKLAQINSIQQEKIDVYSTRINQLSEDLTRELDNKEKIESMVTTSRVKLSPAPSRSNSNGGVTLMSRQEGTLATLATATATESKELSLEDKMFTKSQGLDALDKIDSVLLELESQLIEQKEILESLEEDTADRLKYLAAMPSQWPIQGRITSYFGYRSNPFTNRGKEFHGGLDIASSYGSTIRAAGDGKVIFAGWNGAFGKTVIISHGFGYTSMYGHNSAILTKVGAKVKRGDAIARLGNTGRSTGPHVHFQIEKYGTPVNPLTILK